MLGNSQAWLDVRSSALKAARCTTKGCRLYPFSAAALKIALADSSVDKYLYTYVINSEAGRWGYCLATQHERVYLGLAFFFSFPSFQLTLRLLIPENKLVLYQNEFHTFLYSDDIAYTGFI